VQRRIDMVGLSSSTLNNYWTSWIVFFFLFHYQINIKNKNINKKGDWKVRKIQLTRKSTFYF
jgi:hypothetical protein